MDILTLSFLSVRLNWICNPRIHIEKYNDVIKSIVKPINIDELETDYTKKVINVNNILDILTLYSKV